MSSLLAVARQVVIGVAFLVLARRGAAAQAAPPSASAPTPPPVPGAPADASVCLGFSFGAWTPPLDWTAAGHGAKPDERTVQQAPSGRDWAADLPRAGRDSTLVLFPRWWPAGVALAIPSGRLVGGDTVEGRATALVADGRLEAPTTTVRAWRVRCDSHR